MRKRCSQLGGLSPWNFKEDSDDEDSMSTFCEKKLPSISNKKSKPLSERINHEFIEKIMPAKEPATPIKIRLSRPKSNVISIKQNNTEHRRALERLSANKENSSSKQVAKTITHHHHKTFRPQSNKSNELQEISIRNFIMEGAREKSNNMLKEATTVGKRKESTFVMKQKFAQIRRSMNLAACTSINRAFKYNCKEDKENALFKMTRYEPQ